MRIFTAILFIFSFAISQYAKQLGYFECRVANALSPADQRCDCEKLLEDNPQNTSSTPINRAHTHIHPDEYLPTLPVVLVPSATIFERGMISYQSPGICTGILSTPFQPPDPGKK